MMYFCYLRRMKRNNLLLGLALGFGALFISQAAEGMRISSDAVKMNTSSFDAATQPSDPVFRPATEFVLLGRGVPVAAQGVPVAGQGVPVTAASDTSDRVPGMDYARLPLSERPNYRPELWYLGMNSAGLSIRFRSNSPSISVRWQPLNNFAMNHMTATGVRGLDLYILREDNGQWAYAGTAQPSQKSDCRATMIAHMDTTYKEFLLHLPLYDGLRSLEIGTPEGFLLEQPAIDLPKRGKPIVFYGTSITQGGCASRPGMAYPAIVQRVLQQETVNLGFSGNARMDASIGDLLATIDAGVYVIDCLPNCTVELVRARGYAFLKTLLDAKPNVPVYMVTYQMEPKTVFDKSLEKGLVEINALWQTIYKRLCAEGYGGRLSYIDNLNLTQGDFSENTVDGTHLTDLGFQRLAQVFVAAFRP